MGRQEGDAYPDPRRQSRSKIKVVVCIGLLLICLGSSITAVAAPGDEFPDPTTAPDPIFGGYPITELPAGNLVTNQAFTIE